jgi:hypothetical protein
MQTFQAVREGSTTLKLITSAIEKYNTAASTLLFHIFSFLREEWDPATRGLALNKNNLEENIEIASAEIQKLIDLNDQRKADEAAKIRSLHFIGKTAESICVNLKPAFKTILSVAIQGSVVRL